MGTFFFFVTSKRTNSKTVLKQILSLLLFLIEVYGHKILHLDDYDVIQ